MMYDVYTMLLTHIPIMCSGFHNITQQHEPSKYNSDTLGVQSVSESLCVAFLTAHLYIQRAHETRAAR
jgi:hypothetical protein